VVLKVDEIRVFIPVGGIGTRLLPLTYNVSKPCIRLLNRPILEFGLSTLAEQGVRNFIFGANGKANFTNLFDQYGEGVGFSAKYGIKSRVHIKYQPNIPDEGSADSLRINMEYYDVEEPVFVAQGDNVFDVDLRNLMEYHLEKNAFLTIGLIEVEDTRQFGVAKLSGDMRIESFVEKPEPEETSSNLASTGIYLFSPKIGQVLKSQEINELMEKNRKEGEKVTLDFGKHLIPYLVSNDFSVYGYSLDKFWSDVGTPKRYLDAMLDMLNGAIDIRITEEPSFPGRNIWIQGYSQDSIIRRERIIRSYKEGKLDLLGNILIGRHARIEENTRIENSNIDNFCILDEGVNVERSAVMDSSTIGEKCDIRDSIIGRYATLESTREYPTKIESYSVVGEGVIIKRGCRISGSKIYPDLTIPPLTELYGKTIRTAHDILEIIRRQ
jgi:NDP-sugar pyrophosphorylase family protein